MQETEGLGRKRGYVNFEPIKKERQNQLQPVENFVERWKTIDMSGIQAVENPVENVDNS